MDYIKKLVENGMMEPAKPGSPEQAADIAYNLLKERCPERKEQKKVFNMMVAIGKAFAAAGTFGEPTPEEIKALRIIADSYEEFLASRDDEDKSKNYFKSRGIS